MGLNSTKVNASLRLQGTELSVRNWVKAFLVSIGEFRVPKALR